MHTGPVITARRTLAQTSSHIDIVINVGVSLAFHHKYSIISYSDNLLLCQCCLSNLISRVGEAKGTELAIANVIETVPPVASILQDYFY